MPDTVGSIEGVVPQSYPGPFQAQVFDVHEWIATLLTTDIFERVGMLYGIGAEISGRPLNMAGCGAGQDETAGR